MNDPQQRWDEQLRAALINQAASIESVTPWAPPADRRRNGRPPWRWFAPLVAAAAVVAVVAGTVAARIAADRDVRPASPTAPTPTVITTVAPTTPPVAPTAPASTRVRYSTSPTDTRSPVVPATTTAAPSRTVVTSTRSDAPTPTTAPARSTVPSPPPATITPCMRNYTYETVTSEWSGVYGIQFSGLSELAQCGGFDDINWFPTGHRFPLHLSATTRIFILRAGGQGDRALPLAQFAAYLFHPFTGLFVVTGPSTHPTSLSEVYHP